MKVLKWLFDLMICTACVFGMLLGRVLGRRFPELSIWLFFVMLCIAPVAMFVGVLTESVGLLFIWLLALVTGLLYVNSLS